MYKFEPGEKATREFIDTNGYPAKISGTILSRKDFHTTKEYYADMGIMAIPDEWGHAFTPFSEYRFRPDGFDSLTLLVRENELSKSVVPMETKDPGYGNTSRRV